MQSKRIVSIIALALLGLFTFLQAAQVSAQSAEMDKARAYFEGKKIRFIVPYKPGGGYDTYARMIAPFLERDLKATVIVQNVPGGGGFLGVNKIYASRPNGRTIGMVNVVGCILSQVANMKGVKYRLEKFGWVGRVVAEPQLMLTRASSPINSIEDIKKLGRPLKYGTTGPGASDYMNGLLLSRAFGFPINMVSGYASSGEYDLAMLKGEVDAVMGSFSSKIGYVKTGDAKPVTILGRNRAKELPDVPTVLETPGLDAEGQKLVKAGNTLLEGGRGTAAPPNMPKERLLVLQNAWNKATSDPKLVAAAEKASRPISNLPGPQMLEVVSELITNIPKPMMQLIMDSHYKK